MVVAIGRIINKDSLIGLRIFDTETKQTKDIRIEDSKKLEIKNINNINKLGAVENKQEDKPLLVLGYKDNKYLTVDINGNTKALESIKGYNTVGLLTNIEQCKKYIRKLGLIGEKPYFEFETVEATDGVILTKYIEDNQDYRVIEIPTFVTGIKIEEKDYYIKNSVFKGFKGIEQSLKVIYKGNKIKSMRGLFYGYKGKQLDLSNFDTSKVTDMSEMFRCCEKLTSLDLSNFDTSKVTNMSLMFDDCYKLTSLDLSNFDTSKVTDMNNMFKLCYKLTSLDVSNFDTSEVTNMYAMFYGCYKFKSFDLSNFDTSKVTNMNNMFSETSLTPENTGLKVKER